MFKWLARWWLQRLSVTRYVFWSIFSELLKEYYLLYNLFTSINTICLYLGMCNFEAIPSSSCPSTLNDNTVPPCSTKRYHSETSFCEGDSGDTPGTTDDEDNCGGYDVYKCIRGNRTNSNHMIIEILWCVKLLIWNLNALQLQRLALSIMTANLRDIAITSMGNANAKAEKIPLIVVIEMLLQYYLLSIINYLWNIINWFEEMYRHL